MFIVKIAVFVACVLPVIYFLGNKYSVASTENKINSYNEVDGMNFMNSQRILLIWYF